MLCGRTRKHSRSRNALEPLLQFSQLISGNFLYFSAQDCFEIGLEAYNSADYYHALAWMQEAFNRVEIENPPTAAFDDVLEHLSLSLYKQGNTLRALALSERLAAIG